MNSYRVVVTVVLACVVGMGGCEDTTGVTGGAGGMGGSGGGSSDPDCPADSREPCVGDISCNYGTETCCGETYASMICDCFDGSFSCYFTDACLVPEKFGCGGSGGMGGMGGAAGTGGAGGMPE